MSQPRKFEVLVAVECVYRVVIEAMDSEDAENQAFRMFTEQDEETWPKPRDSEVNTFGAEAISPEEEEA